MGPATAPIAKLRGEYRFHMQIPGARRGHRCDKWCEAATGFKLPEKVFLAVRR